MKLSDRWGERKRAASSPNKERIIDLNLGPLLIISSKGYWETGNWGVDECAHT